MVLKSLAPAKKKDLHARLEHWSQLLCGSDKRLLALILVIKALSTLLVTQVVARVTPLRDAELYLNWKLGNQFPSMDRVALLGNLTALLKMAFLGSDLAVHFVFSLGVGVSLWVLLRGRRYDLAQAFTLIALLVVPSFAVWGSVVSKEVVAVIFSALFFHLVLTSVASRSLRFSQLGGIVLALAVFATFRYNYAVGHAWALVVLAVLIWTQGPESAARRLLALAIGSVLLAWLLYEINLRWWLEQWFMATVKSYFYGPAEASANLNRNWLQFSTTEDFFSNLWWGMPFSIIGPLPREAVARPLLFPFLIGGVMTLLLYISCFVMAARRWRESSLERTFFWWGLLPGALITWVAHYPFGIFNPGAGMRYLVACSVQFGLAILAFTTARKVGRKT